MTNTTMYHCLISDILGASKTFTDPEYYALYLVLSVLSTPQFSIPDMPEYGCRFWLLKHRLNTEITSTSQIQDMIIEDIKRSLDDPAILDLVNVEVTNLDFKEKENTLYIDISLSTRSGKLFRMRM